VCLPDKKKGAAPKKEAFLETPKTKPRSGWGHPAEEPIRITASKKTDQIKIRPGKANQRGHTVRVQLWMTGEKKGRAEKERKTRQGFFIGTKEMPQHETETKNHRPANAFGIRSALRTGVAARRHDQGGSVPKSETEPGDG